MSKLHYTDEHEVQRVESLLENVLDGLGEPLKVEMDRDGADPRVTITYAKWTVRAVLDEDADFDGERYVDNTKLLRFAMERRR